MSETDAASQEELLILALALHGSSPEIVRGESAPTANGMKVLQQVLIWQRRHLEYETEAEHQALFDPLYKCLIRMSQEKPENRLVRGFGNFGFDGKWVTYPTYVAFGLTEEGQKRSEKLAARFPNL